MSQAVSKQLAIPASGKQPTFEEVANIVTVGALCELSVCVMCLSGEMLDYWLERLAHFPRRVTVLDVLNTNRATLKDWQSFLSQQHYDITVLHGAQAELQAGQLAPAYVTRLVEAVPAGLVMVA